MPSASPARLSPRPASRRVSCCAKRSGSSLRSRWCCWHCRSPPAIWSVARAAVSDASGGGRYTTIGSRRPFSPQPPPHRTPQRQQRVVEVITRVVQHARAAGVTVNAMPAVAVADHKITTRLLLQKETEVFSTHRGFELLHVVGSDQFAQRGARELGLPGMVYRGRIGP